MLVALLSDIHGNDLALYPVLQKIKKMKIDNIIISGDLVGYYYNIIKVLKMLSDFQIYFCRGNHEEMFLKLIKEEVDLEFLTSTYGSSLIKAKSDLSESQIDFLTSAIHPLEINLGGRSILVSHGAPWNINEYIYPDNFEKYEDRFQAFGQEIFILGNTHYQMGIKHSNKIYINPGSVGQSRKNFGSADWAVIDLSNFSTQFFSTKYPTEDLISQCKHFDPNCHLLTKHLV